VKLSFDQCMMFAMAEVVRAQARFAEVARVLEARLRGRQFIVGEGFTAADVIPASALSWANRLGQLPDFPGLQAYAKTQTSRPAARRAFGA
jgi:glutathione S-transferase